MKTILLKMKFVLLATTACIGLASQNEAAVVCLSPDFPPDCGEYASANQIFATYTNPGGGLLEVVLLDSVINNFLNPVLTPLPSGDELEEFDVMLSGDMRQTTPTVTVPYSLTGSVQTIANGKTGNTTGTFQTEMISMSLTGTVNGFNIAIRERPTNASLGGITIADIGGGQFQIDSFFDIHTEISVNGGAWVPADSATLVTLVPEPSSAALLGLGGLAIILRRKR